MAKFNPDVPETQTPNYLSYSRPISPFEGDKSLGIALDGSGKTIALAAHGADEIVKEVINSGLRKDLTRERDIETGALEGMAGIPAEQRLSPYQPDINAPQVLPTEASTIPGELAGLDRDISRAQAGLDNKPALRTLYTGQLDKIAKDYRSRFPGYADYIDERVSAITGGNPANERIRDIMSMLASTASLQKTEREKAINYVVARNGREGAQIELASLMAGGNPLRAYQWGAEQDKIKADYELRALKRADNKGSEEDLKHQAGLDLSADVSKSFSTVWGGVVNSTFGDITPEQMSKVSVDLLSGKVAPNDKEGQALLQSMIAARKQAFDRYMAQASQPGPNDSPSQLARLGMDETKKRIDAGLSVYDTTIDLLKSKDYGGAFINANKAARSQSDEVIALQGNPDETVRKYATQWPAVQHIFGPQGSAVLLQGAIGRKLSTPLQDAVDTKKFEIALNQKTVKQALEELRSKGVGVQTPNKSANETKRENAAFESLLFDVPASIASPQVTDAGKRNLIQGTFGPGNEGLLSKLTQDRVDPNSGQVIAGPNITYSKMLEPKVIDEAYRLGGDSWIHVKNWAEKEYNKIFHSNIQDINTYAQNSNIKLIYDNNPDSPGWRAEYTPAQFHAGTRPGHYNFPSIGTDKIQAEQINTQLQFVNRSLKTLAYIASKEGGDVNAYVVNQMKAIGLDTEAAGMPSKMLKAVLSTAPTAGEIAPVSEKQSSATSGELSSDETLSAKAKSEPALLQRLIDRSEGKGNYNILYGGKKAPITDMTVNEVLAFQKDRKATTGNPAEPVGRYQIIGSTLRTLKKEMGLSGNEKMDEQLQDKMFETLLDRRGMSKYVNGEISKNTLITGLRNEWDGLKNVSDVALRHAIDDYALRRHIVAGQ